MTFRLPLIDQSFPRSTDLDIDASLRDYLTRLERSQLMLLRWQRNEWSLTIDDYFTNLVTGILTYEGEIVTYEGQLVTTGV